LTEEAVRRAKRIEYEGVPAKVFRPEHTIAIAARVGRHKDLARIEQMLEQTEIDRTLLDDILARYKLSLPKP
jgi:predicted nucleotidyltransferase